MRALLLALLLLCSGTAVPAESYAEPFEDDIDGNGLPDFWVRRIGPGYPRYNPLVFPDRESAAEGRSSVRFSMRGGNSALTCQRMLAIDPALTYELSGSIRTSGLDRDAAWIAVEWCDREGSLVATDRSEPVGGSADWSRVELRFETVPAGARFARLVCAVEGPDLTGEAWFDDLRWSEKVGLQVLAPGHPGNVFAEGEEPRLLLRAPALGRGEYRLHARIARFDGSEVPVPAAEPILVPKGFGLEHTWSVPVRETGYFDLFLEVRRGDARLAERRAPLGIVPRLKLARAGGGEYGVVVDPFVPHLSTLLGHLQGMALGRAKVLLRDPREGRAGGAVADAAVDAAIQALKRMGIDPIGVVPAPPRLRLLTAPEGIKVAGLAEVLAAPEEAWKPELVALLGRTQAYASRWQLGADGDHSLQGHPRRAELLARVAEAVGEVTRYPVLGLPVDPAGALDRTGVQFLSLDLPRDMDPARAAEALRAALSQGEVHAVSCALPEVSSADRYAGQRAQIARLAETAIRARLAGGRDFYFHPVTGVQTGLFDVAGDPTPAYFAVRTLSLVLGGARPDPRPLVHDDSLESPVFDLPGGRVAALWARPGRRSGSITLSLGTDTRVLDPTGRVLEVPATGMERTLEPTDLPVFLVDVDAGLLRTQQSLAFRGPRVRLRAGRQRESLGLENGFGETMRSIEVRAGPVGAAVGWQLELLERRRGSLTPGERWEIPVEVELPQNEGISGHEVDVEVRFTAEGREYRFRAPRRLEVASDIELGMDARKDMDSGAWQVTVSVRNAADREMDLKCYLFLEGRTLEPRLLPRVAAGATEVLRFVVPAGAALGRVLRAHVEEIRGSAFCNRDMELE